MKHAFAHFNFNVKDLDKSIAFYKEALGLEEAKRKETETFTLVFMKDCETGFMLELTYLKDFDKSSYDLGDNEFHLAMVSDDFEASYQKHKKMGCICYENKKMGLYFINDPDGYWIEILPKR
ncbi:MAG TPA: VOC family protein [Clostridia bacterium]|nr:MAG: Lactoylglutathione lyase [Firmicutes bacterium ADurb.Bin146]HOD93522.1 VOC family protein [Clostridia bacterium]HQM40105.1 VOC family protein [Clostridia bacterium]